MRLRIVCTNDFLGSLSPMRTSYGQLPGAHALQRKVAQLSEGQPTIWADAGDFSQGGPLSTAGGGVACFHAASELGIEVATVGNHELDWGLPLLAKHGKALPFPLICANLEIGLPPTALLQSDAGPVGFIGLTHPEVDAFTPHAPPLHRDLASIVPTHAEHMREQGAIAVIVLFHFGVNWSVAADGSHQPDPTPVLEVCGPFQHAVDAIVLGHTLGHWADVIDGVPYAQPWPYGAEVGVIDLDLEHARRSARLEAVDAEPTPWTGSGDETIAESEQTVIGDLDAPLTIDFASDISLASFAADALRIAAGATAAVVPVVGMHQPAIEGVMYHWPAGPVTEADLSRFWPWTDDGCLLAEVSPEELSVITQFSAPEPWLAWGTSSAAEAPSGSTTIAIACDYVDWATVQIGQLLGRQLAWRPVDLSLRDAIRTALASGSSHV